MTRLLHGQGPLIARQNFKLTPISLVVQSSIHCAAALKPSRSTTKGAGQSPQKDHSMNIRNLKLYDSTEGTWGAPVALSPHTSVLRKEIDDEICFANDRSFEPVSLHGLVRRSRSLPRRIGREQLCAPWRHGSGLPHRSECPLWSTSRATLHTSLSCTKAKSKGHRSRMGRTAFLRSKLGAI